MLGILYVDHTSGQNRIHECSRFAGSTANNFVQIQQGLEGTQYKHYVLNNCQKTKATTDLSHHMGVLQLQTLPGNIQTTFGVLCKILEHRFGFPSQDLHE